MVKYNQPGDKNNPEKISSRNVEMAPLAVINLIGSGTMGPMTWKHVIGRDVTPSSSDGLVIAMQGSPCRLARRSAPKTFLLCISKLACLRKI